MVGKVLRNIYGGRVNDEISLKIASLLKEKYEVDFNIYAIGRRYGINNFNTVTVICYPADNINNTFIAIYDADKGVIKDNYTISLACKSLESAILSVLKAHDITCTLCLDMFKCSPECVFYGRLLIEDKGYDLRKLKATLSKTLNEFNVVLNIVVLESYDYETCANYFCNRINKSYISKLNKLYEFKYPEV